MAEPPHRRRRSACASALDEPIPGGARFAYIFGSGLLFIFISQVITGVFLALYYVPSADHAHTTVAYITKAVTAGSFLRSLHAYGASAMVVVLFLHLSQTYIYGAYKGRREILWLSGCALFGLVLAMAFTGYLLPWDQRAYFATAVGTNAVSEIPWIGESIKRLMRGGTEMGTLTISRFFVAHVFLIPALYLRACGLPYFFLPQSWSGRTGQRRSLPSQTESGALLPSPSADGSLADGAADCGTRLAVLFRADATGAAGEPSGCAVCTAARVVLPAHISMAEILAWVGCDRRRAGNSNAPRPGHPCAFLFWIAASNVVRGSGLQPWERTRSWSSRCWAWVCAASIWIATIREWPSNWRSRRPKKPNMHANHSSQNFLPHRWLRQM